jgi:hypothetical protein
MQPLTLWHIFYLEATRSLPGIELRYSSARSTLALHQEQRTNE